MHSVMNDRKKAPDPDGDTTDRAAVPGGSDTKTSGQDVGPSGARVDDETPLGKDNADDAKRLRRQE